MARLRIIAVVVLLVLVAAACSRSADEPTLSPSSAPPPTTASTTTTDPESLAFAEGSAEPHELRIGIPRMRFVAPHLVDEVDPIEVMVTDLLTDGLTERNPRTGRAEPAIAESWTVSDDRLTWTFALGEWTFGSGDPIEADDVVASLNRLAALGIDSLSGPSLEVVDGYASVADGSADTMDGATAVDSRTVEISLTEPYEPLPELLAGVTFGVYPVEPTANGLPESSSTRFEPTELLDDGLRVSALRSDDPISAIELRIDPDAEAPDADIDLWLGLDPEAELGDRRASAAQRSADAFFAMNHEVPPFDDPDVRRAVVQAVDRTKLQDDYFPHAGVMQSFVPQHVPGGSVDACGDLCAFDPEAARRAVEAAEAQDTDFTVDFFVGEEEDDLEQRLAEAIVSDLRAVGLNATAQAHRVEEYGTLIAEGELELFRFGSISTALTADADLARMFTSDGRDNVTGTDLAEFDLLVAAARSQPDADARAQLYAEAEAILFDEAVVLPLVEFRHHLVFTDAIETASLEPDGSLDLDSIVFAN